MFHLIKAQLQVASEDQQTDPVVATTLDSKNAFNNLTRAHLVNVLDAGCDRYATLPEDEEHDKPVGWDIMYGHTFEHTMASVATSSTTVAAKFSPYRVKVGCSKETRWAANCLLWPYTLYFWTLVHDTQKSSSQPTTA